MNQPKPHLQASSHLPMLPSAKGQPPEGWTDALRRFHVGERPGNLAQELRSGSYVPALLQPYRQAGAVRTAYPLVLRADGAQPLSEALDELVRSFAPGADESRLLKDNLVRLERTVAERLGASAESAAAALDFAGSTMLQTLALREEPARKLQQELYCLVDAVPAGTRLQPLGPDTALQLLLHGAQHALDQRRAEHAARLDALRQQVRQRLDTERRHSPAARSQAAVAGSVGAVGTRLFDPGALARVVDQRRGTVAMAPERQARLQECLDALDAFDLARLPLVTVVHGPDRAAPQVPGAAVVSAADPLFAAAERYEAHAAALVDVLRAERIARLELDDAYDPAHHDAVLSALDWTAMSRDELLLVPTVVALLPGASLHGARLGALLGLLSSGRPLQVLVEVDPTVDALTAGPAQGGSRLELAQVALALREPLVHQGSVTRPLDMIAGFERALTTPRPGLHLLVALPEGGAGASLGGWFHAEAAVESRAHPLLRFEPDLGPDLASRLSAEGNPAPRQVWSTGTLTCLGPDGQEQALELPFTYADFALLQPALAEHFMALPVGGDTPELTSLLDWLAMDLDAALRRVPWIHAVDDQDRVVRLALSRRLAFACRDRGDAWRTLQELVGFDNAHVHRAVAAVRAELEAAQQAELQALQQAHAAALDEARQTAAAEALGRLADALVQPDASFLATSVAGLAPAAPASAPRAAATPAAAEAAEAPAAAAQVAAAPAEEEDDLVLGDPWIDSILCSSCNDCLQINPVMFVYNDQKQAMIGDVSKGTFEQLVRAAEKCPSRCIHPGKPLNPSEPHLDDLVQRAAAYQ